MSDYDEEIFDHSNYPKEVSCKRCGAEGLFWIRGGNKKWYLYDPHEKEKHLCTRYEVKPDKKLIINNESEF